MNDDSEIKDGGRKIGDMKADKWKMEFSAYEWMLINMSMAVVGAIMQGQQEIANNRLAYLNMVADEKIFTDVAHAIGVKGMSRGREN